jgi:bifunctional non-homologous end joining protein LigD
VHHESPASLGIGAGPERAYSAWRPGPSSGRRATPTLARLVRDLERIEARGGAGTLRLPDGARLSVSRLTAVVWPTLGITKGALMRYYVRVAPLILPTLDGRPLGAKYYPEGLAGESFFQQRAPLAPPPGARVEILPINTPVKRRLVGGPLLTLLAMIELGAISQDPWLSRLPSLDTPDHAVFDLDPMPGVPFSSVIDVARWLHDELARHGATAFAKTSGGTGLHVYVPLVAGIPFDSARRFTERIAAPVAARHARLATTERAVAGRGERVYIDCLQNLRGKTCATAYSVRATWSAGVSTPITWDELESGIAPRDFTLRTLPARLRAHGDLWAAGRASRGFDPRSGDTRGR